MINTTNLSVEPGQAHFAPDAGERGDLGTRR
jgi:hypothetical protein